MKLDGFTGIKAIVFINRPQFIFSLTVMQAVGEKQAHMQPYFCTVG